VEIVIQWWLDIGLNFPSKRLLFAQLRICS
jgi:hypothetical protein